MTLPAWVDPVLLDAALKTTPDGYRWHADARCGDIDDSLFFPDKRTLAAYKPAITFCSGCQVRYQCLAAHLDEDHGCFGGTPPGERRTIRATLELRRRDTAA